MAKVFQAVDHALPHIPGLSPYIPGTQPEGDGWIKLNTNESPYPPSPRIGPAISATFRRLALYPNPTSGPLRDAIARRHGLGGDQVIVGNGSDDILNLLVRVFIGNASVGAMAFPSYSLYPVLAGIQSGRIVEVPFKADMALPVEEIVATNTNIVFLTSPNAPTGVGFPNSEIARLAGELEGILVVDEAYGEFADETAVDVLREHPNVIVTRTFSKSYGLAGLRVGYAMSSPEIINLLDRVRDSYNVNALSQAGALAAFEDVRHLAANVEKVKATRAAFSEFLAELGWFTYPSQANFVFTRPVTAAGESGDQVAADLFEFLKEQRILVRYFPKHPATSPFLRISMGTDDQMRKVREAIEAWQKSA